MRRIPLSLGQDRADLAVGLLDVELDWPVAIHGGEFLGSELLDPLVLGSACQVANARLSGRLPPGPRRDFPEAMFAAELVLFAPRLTFVFTAFSCRTRSLLVVLGPQRIGPQRIGVPGRLDAEVWSARERGTRTEWVYRLPGRDDARVSAG